MVREMINHNMNTNEHWEEANGDNETHDFSPEVHVLAGTLVPIVSTNTWWFGG
jgi:hypothetical protein